MHEDLEGPEPMYRTLAGILAQRVGKGVYPPRKRMPSESEICEAFDVSRRTAREAYALLVEDGTVVRVPGKGTYPRG